MLELIKVISQKNLKSIYIHQILKEYAFCSVVHGIFCKTDLMLGHKANLNRLRKTEIINFILVHHRGVTVDTNKRNGRKHIKSWKMNNSLMNDRNQEGN